MPIRASIRLLRLLIHIFAGIFTCYRVFPRDSRTMTESNYQQMQIWFRKLLCILQVEVNSSGKPINGALYVSNHISWLDIVVIGSVADISYLSKSDVKRWPLIGTLVTRSGTMYIERGKSDTQTIAKQIAERLSRGQNIGIFPEGTTRENRDVGRFHARLFSVSTEYGYPIQPVALEYPNSPWVPYLGEQSFINNLWQLCSAEKSSAYVVFPAAIHPEQNQTRKSVASIAEQAVKDELSEA